MPGIHQLEDLSERQFSPGWQARCPACAKNGGDPFAAHLLIDPDYFFCCVADNSRAHRWIILSECFDLQLDPALDGPQADPPPEPRPRKKFKKGNVTRPATTPPSTGPIEPGVNVTQPEKGES